VLISYHENELYEVIVKHDIIGLVMSLSHSRLTTRTRSNCMLAVSLMTYNDKLFKFLLKNNVIDQLLEISKDKVSNDVDVKLYSTQALVHFALN
jgi:hypothetical protein